MTAFLGLSASHTSSIQAVAPGIAEALITTAVGLVAAIPAQMFYNYFIARVRVLATEMDNFTVRIFEHRRASFPFVGSIAMAFDPGQRGQMVSQINVTPLVDVMLVLLVIFMVTAPIIQQGVEVTLPSVKAEALPGKEEQFVVSITRDSQIYLNDAKLSADDLTGKLKAIAQ